MTDRLGGRRVLVTGAGGFIASHLVQALLGEGAEVRAYVHYNSRNDRGNLERLPAAELREVEIVSGEIQDPFSVVRAVAGREVVFHLAALIGIPYSYVAPGSYVSTNVTGTLNLLEAARDAQVERIVHTSTSETYGTAQYVPIDEHHPLVGQSPYSASKIGADALAESYHRSFDLPVTTLRPFNTFGPRQSLRAVIPTIIAQALRGERVKLGSLDPMRDFTFVVDTARAFIAAAMSDGAVGHTLNAGSGQSISIGRLAELILELSGSDAKLIADADRVRPADSEVLELRADATALRELTGWEPQVGLRDGLVQTIDWMRSAAAERAHEYTV